MGTKRYQIAKNLNLIGVNYPDDFAGHMVESSVSSMATSTTTPI
jgi:hypothetical protein